MATLGELASLIRSKNAGPFQLTIDVMFNKPENFLRVVQSGVITRELIASMFQTPEEQVELFTVDNALAIKASLPRPVPQGDIGDSDSHGGQQYAPLVDLDVP